MGDEGGRGREECYSLSGSGAGLKSGPIRPLCCYVVIEIYIPCKTKSKTTRFSKTSNTTDRTTQMISVRSENLVSPHPENHEGHPPVHS